MKNPVEFEIQDRLWEETLQTLQQQTDHEEEELRRGLIFMLGRRAGRLLQEMGQEPSEEQIQELEIAILHSRQEK